MGGHKGHSDRLSYCDSKLAMVLFVKVRASSLDVKVLISSDEMRRDDYRLQPSPRYTERSGSSLDLSLQTMSCLCAVLCLVAKFVGVSAGIPFCARFGLV